MIEIVAARIGTVITNNRAEIISAIKVNSDNVEFLDRTRMRFLAALDLGPEWWALAIGKTLFRIDDDGNVTDGLP